MLGISQNMQNCPRFQTVTRGLFKWKILFFQIEAFLDLWRVGGCKNGCTQPTIGVEGKAEDFKQTQTWDLEG